MCMSQFSISHHSFSFYHIFFLCKMQSDTLPSDVSVFFLFQESRINCIRIARKGNLTWIFLPLQTLRPWIHYTASFPSAMQLSPCSHHSKIRNYGCNCNSVVYQFILQRYLLLSQVQRWGFGQIFSDDFGCLAVGLREKGNKQGGIRGQAFILFVWGLTLGHAISKVVPLFSSAAH